MFENQISCKNCGVILDTRYVKTNGKKGNGYSIMTIREVDVADYLGFPSEELLECPVCKETIGIDNGYVYVEDVSAL